MPASYNHYWSLFKAWKDWKVACLSFADSDVCSEYELKRRARYLGIPVAQLRWVSSYRPDPISLLERRMEAQMTNLDEGKDLTSADHERDTRTFGAMIKNIEQVKEMQADLERVAGGQPKSAADAELFAEADRFRREIAERLARFIPPAG